VADFDGDDVVTLDRRVIAALVGQSIEQFIESAPPKSMTAFAAPVVVAVQLPGQFSPAVERGPLPTRLVA
jgi:hypothetical protein